MVFFFMQFPWLDRKQLIKAKLSSLQNSTILAWHFSERKKSTLTESEEVPKVINSLKLGVKVFSKYSRMDLAEVYGVLLLK